MADLESLREDGPFHPDRDGCDCLKRDLMDEEECVHDDPCWTSRAAYEASLPKPDPYRVSEERLAEIRAMLTPASEQSSWQTVTAEGVTKHALAGAVEDLLAERDGRG